MTRSEDCGKTLNYKKLLLDTKICQELENRSASIPEMDIPAERETPSLDTVKDNINWRLLTEKLPEPHQTTPFTTDKAMVELISNTLYPPKRDKPDRERRETQNDENITGKRKRRKQFGELNRGTRRRQLPECYQVNGRNHRPPSLMELRPFAPIYSRDDPRKIQGTSARDRIHCGS